MRSLVIICASIAMMFTCLSASAEGLSGGTNLIFSTGGSHGTYYGFGKVLAEKIGETTSTSLTVVTSGGSQENIEAMREGYADLGFVQTDVAAYAYNGTRLFNEIGNDFSTVANLYMEQVQIVTLNPKIKTVSDLKGHVVSIGTVGSGVYFNAIDILHVYGLQVEKDIRATFQSIGESTEALKNGKIDAAFIVAGAPTKAISTLSREKQIYLINLDKEHIDTLIKTSKYYSESTIGTNIYALKNEVKTVAVGAVVIAQDDVSEVDVYNFLSGVYNHLDEIKKIHVKGNELDIKFATSYDAVPYHKGAVKFFKEKGINVKSK